MKPITSTFEYEERGLIWRDAKGKWHTRCPACNHVRTHKHRGASIDAVHVLCRDCHVERHGNPWQELRLLYKLRKQEDW